MFGFGKDSIAFIKLAGMVGEHEKVSCQNVANCLARAKKLSNPQAVILSIDSPGGSPVEAERIFNLVRKRTGLEDIPFYAFIKNVGASAAYWIACACDEIYCYRTSTVGSIGVIMDGGFGLNHVLDKYDIERRLRTAGNKKGMLDPFSPLTADQGLHLDNVLADLHEEFISVVKDSRGDKLKEDEFDDIFSGAWFTGKQALGRGLVDGAGDLSELITEWYGKDIRIAHIAPKVRRKGLLRTVFGTLASCFVDEIANRLRAQSIYPEFR